MNAQRIYALVRYFETLSPETVGTLPQYYAQECRFVDPFSDVRGVERVAAIFRHMFEQLDTPRFIVRDRVAESSQVLLTWDFEFSFRRWRPGKVQRIHGASLLTLDAAGLVAVHRDYWDAAELYEKLPAIGLLLRALKRRGRPQAPLGE
ncbi:MAG: nuclear transport factor 2 family protein [Burkholderiales bacterium]|nr:nuclear transport factor 2 family protein [Burkholderiales bacterium]